MSAWACHIIRHVWLSGCTPTRSLLYRLTLPLFFLFAYYKYNFAVWYRIGMSLDFDSHCCSNGGGLESVRPLTAIEYCALPAARSAQIDYCGKSVMYYMKCKRLLEWAIKLNNCAVYNVQSSLVSPPPPNTWTMLSWSRVTSWLSLQQNDTTLATPEPLEGQSDPENSKLISQ